MENCKQVEKGGKFCLPPASALHAELRVDVCTIELQGTWKGSAACTCASDPFVCPLDIGSNALNMCHESCFPPPQPCVPFSQLLVGTSCVGALSRPWTDECRSSRWPRRLPESPCKRAGPGTAKRP